MESDGVAIKEENDRDYGKNIKLPVDEFLKRSLALPKFVFLLHF